MEEMKEGSNGKIDGDNVNVSKVRGIFPVLWIRFIRSFIFVTYLNVSCIL
jgi:hypothetical protein